MRLSKQLVPAIVLIFAAAALFYFFFFAANGPKTTPTPEYHAHVDFAVFIRGERFDFSQKQFMHQETCGKPGEEHKEIDLSTAEGMRDAMHLHDVNGNVLHSHHENATLSMFFKGLGFDLTASCIQTTRGSYCNTQTETLKVFVNEVEEKNFVNYKPRDLDGVLITFGSESPALVRAQYETMASQACIYSEKCPKPEGFAMTPESCV